MPNWHKSACKKQYWFSYSFFFTSCWNSFEQISFMKYFSKFFFVQNYISAKRIFRFREDTFKWQGGTFPLKHLVACNVHVHIKRNSCMKTLTNFSEYLNCNPYFFTLLQHNLELFPFRFMFFFLSFIILKNKINFCYSDGYVPVPSYLASFMRNGNFTLMMGINKSTCWCRWHKICLKKL